MYKKLLEKTAKFNKIVRAQDTSDNYAVVDEAKKLAKEFDDLRGYSGYYPPQSNTISDNFSDTFTGFKGAGIQTELLGFPSNADGATRLKFLSYLEGLERDVNGAPHNKVKELWYDHGHKILLKLIALIKSQGSPAGAQKVNSADTVIRDPPLNIYTPYLEPAQTTKPGTTAPAQTTKPGTTAPSPGRGYILINADGKVMDQVRDKAWIEYTQKKLGVGVDGKWGPLSTAAFKAKQKELGESSGDANTCMIVAGSKMAIFLGVSNAETNQKGLSTDKDTTRIGNSQSEGDSGVDTAALGQAVQNTVAPADKMKADLANAAKASKKSLYEIIVQSQATPSIVDQYKSFPEASPVIIEADKPTSLTKVLVGPKGPITDRDQIEAVQYVLSKQPIIMFDLTKIDGKWGPQSDKALKLFQKLNNIGTVMGQSGKLDDATYLILLQKAEALTSDADKVYVNNLRKINQLSSVEPTALPTSQAKTIYEMVVTAQNMDELAKLQAAENKAIVDTIGGNFAGSYTNVSNGSSIRIVTFIGGKISEADLKANIEPKLLDVAAAMRKVRPLDKIYFYYKPTSGEERLVKQASFKKKAANPTLKEACFPIFQDIQHTYALDQSGRSQSEITKKQLLPLFQKSFAASAKSKGEKPVGVGVVCAFIEDKDMNVTVKFVPMNNAAGMNLDEGELTKFIGVNLKDFENRMNAAIAPCVMDPSYARSKPLVIQYSEPAVVTQP